MMELLLPLLLLLSLLNKMLKMVMVQCTLFIHIIIPDGRGFI